MYSPAMLGTFTGLMIALARLGMGAGSLEDGTAIGCPPPTLSPRHAIDFEYESISGRSLFSKDGTTFFLPTRGRAVNVWEILVHYWPELAIVAAFLATFGAGLKVIGIRRRCQFPGKLHCPACNYCLTALPSGLCPECGCDLSARPPILGRSTRRRVLPYGASIVVLWIACLMLVLWGPPRDSPASAWFGWWSPALLEWGLQKKETRITDFETEISRIVAVEVPQGRVDRILATIRSRNGLIPWGLTPDGTILIADDIGKRELLFLDTDTGRVLKTVSYYDDAGGKTGRAPEVFGVSSDGQTAFVRQTRGLGNSGTEVTAIDLDNGKRTFHVQIAAPLGDRRRPRLVVRPDAEPKIVEITSAEYGTGSTRLVVYDTAPPYEAKHYPELHARVCSGGVFSHDLRTVFWYSPSPAGLVGWDISAGKQILFLPMPEGRRSLWTPLYDDRYARLFVTTAGLRGHGAQKCRISVADMRVPAWVGDLEYTPDALAGQPHRLVASPDGKTFVAQCMKRRRGTRSRASKLLLWDLSVLAAPGEVGEVPRSVREDL